MRGWMQSTRVFCLQVVGSKKIGSHAWFDSNDMERDLGWPSLAVSTAVAAHGEATPWVIHLPNIPANIPHNKRRPKSAFVLFILLGKRTSTISMDANQISWSIIQLKYQQRNYIQCRGTNDEASSKDPVQARSLTAPMKEYSKCVRINAKLKVTSMPAISWHKQLKLTAILSGRIEQNVASSDGCKSSWDHPSTGVTSTRRLRSSINFPSLYCWDSSYARSWGYV